MLERLFQLKAHGTDVRTEVLAGLTTFLTMAYIVFVNPEILGSAGMPREAVAIGGAEDILPLGEIAEALLQQARKRGGGNRV